MPVLIFDCDGVLVDSEAIYSEVALDYLGRLGLRYEREAYCNRFIGMRDTDYFAAVAADHVAAGLGPFPDAAPDEMKAEVYRRMREELTSVSGAADFLAAHAGPRAVASSSEVAPLHRKLRATGLHAFFDPHIYSGAQVERSKPAPDLFLFAADRLGATPADCIVIEDSINGVRAGVAAGMQVWGFTGGGHADAGLAERLSEAGARRMMTSYPEIAAAWAAI